MHSPEAGKGVTALQEQVAGLHAAGRIACVCMVMADPETLQRNQA
jgi:hypothetical protein